MLELARVVEEDEMKKKVFLCIAVSLVVFESMARETSTIDVQKRHSLMDFFRGGTKGRISQDGQESSYNEDNYKINNYGDRSGDVAIGNSRENIGPRRNSSSTEFQSVPVDQVSVLSDKIVEAPLITEQKLEEDQAPLEISEENQIDEVFVNSFHGVTNLNDLLKNIQSNVESLTFGRMSNDDYNKLIQKKQKISVSKDQYEKSTLAYDKICAMEKILIDYNSVSEISVHFLSDIAKQEINKVQESLFLSEVDALGDGLTYTFKTQISDNLRNSILNVHKEITNYEIKEFSHKLLKEIEKIPNELLDPIQHAKVEKILEEIHSPISGNFETKCAALKHLVESYNDLKSIPFRLKKISSDSVKKLALRAVEDIFFEKMLKTLRTMDEEHYSATSENDCEVLAALNIKKALRKMLGGTSYSGKEYKSNIELFRTADSLAEKQSLLKDSISQFNKAVDLFKIAVDSLKSEGRRPKLRNIDEINTINEDIDKIFEKIAIYDKNAKKEGPESVQEVIIEKNEVIPDKFSMQSVPNNSSDKVALDRKPEAAIDNANAKNPVISADAAIPGKAQTSEAKNSSEDFDLAEMEKALVESENQLN